jgi:quercetin dioxygenase-like cupin family protein
MAADRSKIVKYGAGTWEHVEVRRYKDEDGRHRGVTRRTLVGDAGDEAATSFVTRVFEVAPGGYSTLERHEHPHTVVVLEGRGTVILDDQAKAVSAFDCVYVAPHTAHQFQAGDERLVFLCIVDRVRDRPQPLSGDEMRALRARDVAVKGPKHG